MTPAPSRPQEALASTSLHTHPKPLPASFRRTRAAGAPDCAICPCRLHKSHRRVILNSDLCRLLCSRAASLQQHLAQVHVQEPARRCGPIGQETTSLQPHPLTIWPPQASAIGRRSLRTPHPRLSCRYRRVECSLGQYQSPAASDYPTGRSESSHHIVRPARTFQRSRFLQADIVFPEPRGCPAH